MKKGLKTALRSVAALLILIIAAAVTVVLLFLYNKPLVKNLLVRQLNKRPGMSVSVGKLDYRLFPFRLDIEAAAVVMEDALMRLEASVQGMTVTGDLKKLYRGEKPAFEAVIIRGADIKFEQKAVSGEQVDLEGLVEQAAGFLDYAGRIALERCGVRVHAAGGSLQADGLDLKIVRSAERPGFFLELEAPAVRAAGGNGAFESVTGLKASASLKPAPSLAANLRLTLFRPNLSAAAFERPLTFDSVSADLDAIWRLKENSLYVSKYVLRVPGLAEADGAVSASFGEAIRLDTYSSLKTASLKALVALAGDRLPEQLKGLDFDSDLTVEGRFSLAGGEARFDVQALLDAGRFRTAVSGIPLRGGFRARLTASGTPEDIRVAGSLEASLAGFSTAGATFGDSTLDLSFKATPRAVKVDRARFRSNRFAYVLSEEKRWEFDRLEAAFQTAFDPGRRRVTLRSAEVRLAGLPPVTLSGWAGLAGGVTGDMTLEIRGLAVPKARELLAEFIPARLSGWEAGGNIDLTAGAKRLSAGSEEWKAAVSLALKGAAFNDPEFTMAGEKLEPKLELAGAFDPAKQSLAFSGRLVLSAGESLLKSFYVSWDRNPVEATLQGLFFPGESRFEGLSARVFFPTIGELNVHGSGRLGPTAALELDSDFKLAAGPLLALYSQAGAEKGSQLKMSGKVSGRADISVGGAGTKVSGRTAVSLERLEKPAAKLTLEDLSCDIPFILDLRREEAGRQESGDLPEKGRLSLGKLRTPLLAFDGVEAALAAGPNRFKLEPLALGLFGGRLEFGRIALFIDPAGRAFTGRASMRLDELDLAGLPFASGEVRLTGKARLVFPEIELSRERLGIRGQGELRVFGGLIQLSNFAVDKPFSESRRVSLDVDIVDVDLKKLTDEVPFGEVTGIIRGEVRELTFSYGQPERFYLKIESVPRKGVPQTFSLKAVDNLTILSSGERASAGTSPLWMRFVRGFQYRKLGIVSTLHNDTFTLNGTIKEGGIEYLVKKPLFFGINVINRMPDKKISFREMMDRISRVGQSETGSKSKGG